VTQPVTLVVSIDTEEDNWQPARGGITIENIRELPRLHRALDGLGVRPTYLATYQVARQEWAAEILRGICTGGTAEIGAHMHPWNTPPLDEEFVPRNTMLSNLPQALQEAKVACLTETLDRAMGTRPRSFRAGRWGLGRSSAAALLDCGYTSDCSVTPFQSWERYDAGPSHVGAPLEVYRLDGRGDPRVPVPDGELVEVPVSSGYSRLPVRTWARVHEFFDRPAARRLRLAGVASRLGLITHITLSPEIDSATDMLLLSRRLIAQGVRLLHVTWHSPTLAPGLTPFAATRGDVERLYATLGTYVNGLAALAPLRCATVSEAAAQSDRRGLSPEAPPARRLIVVSYHHPPDGAIGGMRWAGLTKYLQPLGWKSWVVTAAPPAPRAEGASTVVVSCPRRATLHDWWRRLRNGKATPAPRGQLAQAEASNGQSGMVGQLRLEVAMLLALPDEARGWVLRAAARTRTLIRQMKPDVVVSSGPPHSAHLAAWLATRGTRTRWLVDLRDPWAGPVTEAWRSGPWYQSFLSRFLGAQLERLALAGAGGVICNTQEFAAAMRVRCPAVQAAWVPNGVDCALLPSPEIALFPGLAMACVGTIYGGRDLQPVLEALRMLLDTSTRIAGEPAPMLRVAGVLEPPYADRFERDVRRLGLEQSVAHLGVVSRDAALTLVARSRLAFVLAQGQDLQVPAKLYETVAMGVPVVVLAPASSASASEARRLGAFAIEPDDHIGIVRLMERVWRGPVPAVSGGREAVSYARVAELVDDVLSGRAPTRGARIGSEKEPTGAER